MSNYEKIDLSVLKGRIKSGVYTSITGANRAIGKTHGLEEADRAALKKFAVKHFGVEAPVAAKVKAPKPVAKADVKPAPAAKPAKVAKAPRGKKATKRVAKKAPKSAPAAEPAPAGEEDNYYKDDSPKQEHKRSAQLKLPFDFADPAVARANTVQLMGKVIGTCADVLTALKVAEELYPKGELAESVTTATTAMTQAVKVMAQAAVSPLIKDSALAPVAKAKPAPKKVTTNKVGKPFPATAPADDVMPLDAIGLDDVEEAKELPEPASAVS